MANKIVTLDVRPIISEGNDPFSEIMGIIVKLSDDETLEIINTFEPIPLINKLKAEGYHSWTERPNPGVIHTFFKKETAGETENELENIEASDEVSFKEKVDFFGDKKCTIDVRHLEMPEPMVAILKELETLDNEYALFVEHKKMPQFLLPELKNRNYTVMFNEIENNHLQLLIYKSK